ncbi:MAG: sensor histidine kinase [Ilumatobacter sp.]
MSHPSSQKSADASTRRALSLITLVVGLTAVAAALALGAVAVSVMSSEVQANEIDIASRQQLLTQRIGDATADLREDPNNTAARTELLRSSELLSTIRLGLLRGDARLGLDGEVPAEFAALYAADGLDLDSRMGRFERAAGDIAAVAGPVNSAAAAMIDAEVEGDRLIADLDQAIASLTAAQTLQASDNSQRTFITMALAGALMLGSVAALVMVRRRLGQREVTPVRVVEPTDRPTLTQTAAIARAQEAEAELDHTRSVVLASISHDLRMPLTSMVGYLEILGDEEAGPLNDEQQRMVGTALRNGTRLGRLVDDLLLVSLGTHGSAATTEMVDLALLAEDVKDSLAPRAADGRVALRVLRDSRDPVNVRGSRRQLEQVMLHVVGNALKFTPKRGRVQIEVGLDPSDPASARVRVIDNGVGLSKDRLEHLRERLSLTKRAESRQLNGTGLGLAIAHRFIESHGGQLKISSVESAGTTVTIDLPTVDAVAPAGALQSVLWPLGSRMRETLAARAVEAVEAAPSR